MQICIDHSNEAHLSRQINDMHAIYSGAMLTIVNLHGESAESGLPRLPHSLNEDQERLTCPEDAKQITMQVGILDFISCLPTLKQQLEKSVWNTRAWTYQEALLSPRCLFVSDDQMYFECNVLQSCESLDETHSGLHNMSYHQISTQLKQFTNRSDLIIGNGVFRGLVSKSFPTNEKPDSLWADVVKIYSKRQMSYQSDALNAFKAVLAYLEKNALPEGTFWGLPIQYMPQCLHWDSTDQISRKEFPSWSCLGWKGSIETLFCTIPWKAESIWIGKVQKDRIQLLHPRQSDSSVAPPWEQPGSIITFLSGLTSTNLDQLLVIRGYIHSWELAIEPDSTSDNRYDSPKFRQFYATVNNLERIAFSTSYEDLSPIDRATTRHLHLLRLYDNGLHLQEGLLPFKYEHRGTESLIILHDIQEHIVMDSRGVEETIMLASRGGVIHVNHTHGYSFPSRVDKELLYVDGDINRGYRDGFFKYVNEGWEYRTIVLR
jgi:hypothetical protein